ncbi:MAG: copper resistance D family protein, partial [Micromonosporaceae bacterium]
MTTSTRPPPTVAVPSTRRWGLTAAAVSLAVLLAALALGGGTAEAVPGLPDPGGLTRWGLPVAKVVLDGASAVTVGMLALAVMLPARRGEMGRDALLAMRAAAIAAVVWAAAAGVVHLLTLSDLVGQPLRDALAGDAFASYTGSVPQGKAYASVVVLALVIVPAARLTLSRGGAIAVLCLGIGTLIPPALTGHSATGDYHHSAVTSLIVHLVGMAVWVGGLVAVSWYAAGGGIHLARVARAYSPIALACFVMVGASGVLNAWVRIPSLGDLVTTAYGAM